VAVSDSPLPARGSTSGRSRFDERLSVPLWWYVLAIGVAVLLGAEIHMGYPGIRSWIGYAICVPVAVLALVLLGRTRVRVADGTLQVGSAVKDVRHLGLAEIVPKANRQVALGPELDPAAYLMLRAWIRPVVRVEITDPDDPTPYWVFSVRDAPGLLAALKE
jgi:Protein of unknown function (DUF3093)